MAEDVKKEAPTGINRLIAERRIEQALMTLGLTFAECSGLVEYDAAAETAFWKYNPQTGVESIHIGPKVANLDQGSIEMVLRHEILHRSLYHGFGEKYVNRELCNLTLDVCINRLLFEAYPEKMRKCSEQMYPADSKLTPIALADCSADATRLPDELSTLWQSIWAKQADGGYPSVNPASLYFRLLRLSELPTWIVFTMGRPHYDGPGKPTSRAGRLVVAVADEIARRLPKGSDLGRVLSDYTVVPISIGNSRVEEFLKKLQVRKIADATAAKVLEPFQRQVVVQPFPAFPSRLGIVYRLCGVSELFFRYWNKEVANSGARMAIGVYMDVSGLDDRQVRRGERLRQLAQGISAEGAGVRHRGARGGGGGAGPGPDQGRRRHRLRRPHQLHAGRPRHRSGGAVHRRRGPRHRRRRPHAAAQQKTPVRRLLDQGGAAQGAEPAGPLRQERHHRHPRLKERPMQKQLKEILSKLVAGESLVEGELGYLKELVAEKKQDDSAPRPLWHWMREQGFLWGRVLDVRFDWPLDGELDPILLDAGAKVDGRLENAVARRNALVTREALHKAVKKHLGAESTGTRAHATLLVGLCRFGDLLPLVVDSLATGREERQSWGQPVICAGLRTIVMLRHPQARELAAKYTSHEDPKLRQAAQAAHLLDPPGSEPLSEKQLAEALEAEMDVALLTNFRDQMARAVAGGHELKGKITTILDNTYRSINLCRSAARIAVASKWEDKLEELLAHSDADVRGAMACECAWNAEAAWALPLLKARIDDEDDANVQAALVAACCSLEPDDAGFWRQQLGSDNAGCRNGALWGAAGIKARNDAIAEKLTDDDDDVKRTAATLLTLNAETVSPEEVELRYADQTALPSWWTWLIAVKALDAAGVDKPEMVIDFNFTVDEHRPFDPGWLERARAFYAERSWRLIKRLGPDFVQNEEARKRHVALAGLCGGAALEAALERRLSTVESFWEAQELFVEVRAAGGPTTGVGRVVGKLVCAEQDRPVEMEDGDFLAAVAVAIGRGDETLRARATATLLKFGDRVEPFLYNLTNAVELEVANAAANAVAQLSPADPYLADLARLMNGEVRRLDQLDHADLLCRCNAWRVRAKLAETAGLPENDLARVEPYLLALIGDSQQEVQLAAMSSLAARAGGELWVKTLLLERSKSQDWRARRHAVDTMAEMADPHFLGQLLELLGQDQDSDVKNSAVKALDAIADKHPERGMLVLDIREPRRVNERYGMEEQYDYSGDQRAEALRLLMVALDRRKNDGAARGKVGQKVMISRAAASAEDAQSARPLTPEEFEKLALYLKVSFADEETGAVVAEVGAEPTGEVLNALLQTESVVVTNATWS